MLLVVASLCVAVAVGIVASGVLSSSGSPAGQPAGPTIVLDHPGATGSIHMSVAAGKR